MRNHTHLMIYRVTRLTQAARVRFYAERSFEAADRMRKQQGKLYSKEMTAHGGVATFEDVQEAFKAADKMMDVAEEIEAAINKKRGKARAKHARSEAISLGSPPAVKKRKTGSPRSAVKLSDGGPSSGHDVNGRGHGLAAVRAGVITPNGVSPEAKVRNQIEWAARTRVQNRSSPESDLGSCSAD